MGNNFLIVCFYYFWKSGSNYSCYKLPRKTETIWLWICWVHTRHEALHHSKWLAGCFLPIQIFCSSWLRQISWQTCCTLCIICTALRKFASILTFALTLLVILPHKYFTFNANSVLQLGNGQHFAFSFIIETNSYHNYKMTNTWCTVCFSCFLEKSTLSHCNS